MVSVVDGLSYQQRLERTQLDGFNTGVGLVIVTWFKKRKKGNATWLCTQVNRDERGYVTVWLIRAESYCSHRNRNSSAAKY